MVAHYARKTMRLNEALQLLGFLLDGEAGARAAVAQRRSIPAISTILNWYVGFIIVLAAGIRAIFASVDICRDGSAYEVRRLDTAFPAFQALTCCTAL